MKNKSVKKSRKWLSTLLVCGTLLGTASVAGAVLFVEDEGNQFVSAAVVSDDSSTRSITIHKYSNATDAGTPVADNGDFEASIDTTAHKPLANVPFKVVRVTPKAGATSSTIKADDATTYDVDSAFPEKTQVTNADGELTFDLGAGTTNDGFYLVTELSSASVKTPTVPFVVAVPLTVQGATSSDNSLLYDVNVYPKNDTEEVHLNPVKSLVDTDGTTSAVSIKAGESVTWDLSVDVPADIYTPTTVDTAAIYAEKLQLMDPIDTKSLGAPDFGAITGKATGTVGAVDLVNGTDFTATEEASDGLDDYYTVKIELTKSGMEKVAGYDKVSFQVVTKVLEDKTEGLILNSFDTLYVGPTGEKTPETTNPTPDPNPNDQMPTLPDPKNPDENTPEVKMGNVDVLKTDEAGTPLANAVFKLAASEEDVKAENWVTDADGEVVTLTTDAEGKAEFTGLKVDPESGEQNYYLVETSAPTGYALDGTVHLVTAKNDTDVDAAVVNKDNKWVPNLPMTGDDARLILLVTASVLIVTGGSVLYMYHRKEQDNN